MARMHPLLETLRALGRRRRPTGSGTADATYHEGRQRRPSLRYRLRRRTDEVLRAAARHLGAPPRVVVDVGTADGMMLLRLREAWPTARVIGLDLSEEILRTCPDPTLPRGRADAQSIPVRPGAVDLLVATAVIEHVPDPAAVLQEMAQALAPGGLAVLTTPHPFWEHVATLVGHLPDELHYETLHLGALAALCRGAGLQVVEERRFMLSPVGLPWEHWVERQVRRARLSHLFANQLVAARRPLASRSAAARSHGRPRD